MQNPTNHPIQTVCLAIDAPGALSLAERVLRRGHLVAFPTDTVYGVGAHAFLPQAVAQLYQVKGRPAQLPIPLLLPDAAAMATICADIPSLAWDLAEHFWPGGLSLVLHRSPRVPDAVTTGGDTVAVRVPDQPFVRELCHLLEAPLAATSANRHGRPSPILADEVRASLGGRIHLLLDGGPCPGGTASTVLDLTRSPPAILRSGPVTAEELEETIASQDAVFSKDV